LSLNGSTTAPVCAWPSTCGHKKGAQTS